MWGRLQAAQEHAMRMARGSVVLIVVIAAQISLRSAGPRLAPVPESQRTDEQRAIAARFAPADMPNAVATYLNHPSLPDHILPYEHYLSTDSLLPPRHRALVGLRTAWLTRSEYLWAHWAAAPRRAGLTNDELQRVAQGPDAKGWDTLETLLLRAADELHVDSFVSDPTWKTLSTLYPWNILIDLVDSVGS